jgi:TonB family protein
MRPRRTSSSSSYCLLSLADASAGRSAFGHRGGRLGGALGTAIATHVLVVLCVWELAGLRPALQPSADARLSLASSLPPFVFAGATADSGGRDGGGDRSLDPPPPLRTRGADTHSAAASRRRPDSPETIAPERDPTPVLPVVPANAGDVLQAGAVAGVPGPPTDARGPGDGGTGTRRGSHDGAGPAPGDGIGDGVHPIGNGVSAPQLVYRTAPQYTPEAMRAKIQGVAVLSGIVGADGTLRDIRVARSLDGTFGLDQQAIACVRQWRFRPGTRQGQPVAVYVTFEVAFNLR